jgi:soluble lytic murein transglycosylase-like protein
MRTLVLVLNCAAGIFFSTKIDAASTALEIHRDQRNNQYGIGMERNPTTEEYSTDTEPNASNSAELESGRAALLKSTKLEQAAAKYIVRPHSLPLPVNNYTALGMRLRFGADAPPADDVSDNAMARKGQSLSGSANEEMALHDPDDVWERLRLGLKIFWPGFISTQPKNALKQEKLADASRSLDLHDINSESMGSPKTAARENAERKQLAKAKYIIQPHTAGAPLHRYTALGCRLRFGAGNPPGDNADCILPTTAQYRQGSTEDSNDDCLDKVEATSASNYRHQQLKHGNSSLSISGNSHNAPEMIGALAQDKNHSSACSNRQPLSLADSNMPANQSKALENGDTKKMLIDERINRQIRFYSQNPRYLYRVAERARPYLYYIVEQLNQHQLPLELALLPIVESAYQPTAMSPKGAAGLWQFISGTGNDYDLDQNDQYDERLDALASTRAAIRYLSDLNVHFKGDWLLALAAYNCGQGAVDNAINRNLAEGLQADYWSLRLPEETQNYVPRFLALSYIFANPTNYGLKFSPVKNQPYSINITMDIKTNERILSN